MKNTRSQTPASAFKSNTETVATQTDLIPELMASRPAKKRPVVAAFGQLTSFTQGLTFGSNQQVPSTQVEAVDNSRPFASFLTPGGGSFLGDRGRKRIERLRMKQGTGPEIDIHDENYDGAPVVVEDEPMEFMPVVVSEEQQDKLDK